MVPSVAGSVVVGGIVVVVVLVLVVVVGGIVVVVVLVLVVVASVVVLLGVVSSVVVLLGSVGSVVCADAGATTRTTDHSTDAGCAAHATEVRPAEQQRCSKRANLERPPGLKPLKYAWLVNRHRCCPNSVSPVPSAGRSLVLPLPPLRVVRPSLVGPSAY